MRSHDLAIRACGLLLLFVALAVLTSSAIARPRDVSPSRPWTLSTSTGDTINRLPVYDRRLHYAGPVWMTISNFGTIGRGSGPVELRDREALRIRHSPSFEFPAGSRNDYLYEGGIWIGGVVGIDTLVSVSSGDNATTYEWVSFDTLIESSDNKSNRFYDPTAVAEQQYYARYTDTSAVRGVDELENRPHRPLHLEVCQTSYSWADRFARQFILVECWVRNIGIRAIDRMVFGVYLDADVSNSTIENFSRRPPDGDDIAGYLPSAANLSQPDLTDPIDVGWIADNDGEPFGRTFQSNSPSGVIGVRILHAPPGEGVSFNWWVNGEAAATTWGPVRRFKRLPSRRELGTPEGDRGRYYMMSAHEIDYPQLEAGVDHTDEGWDERLRNGACDIADGEDARFLLSVGPSCELLEPGDSVRFVYAVCAGSVFHTRPGERFDCRVPREYMSTLQGEDLALSATWASWIYDTPGLDTDGDGYRGEFHLVNCGGEDTSGVPAGCDTVFYTGDLGPPPSTGTDCVDYGGAPDYVGPETPPCPQAGTDFTVESRPSELIVRWNGRNTETVRDPLSRRYDFEGYRLYIGKSNTEGQYSLVASWDVENYVRYVYDPEPPGRWIQRGGPLRIDELREMYGEDFDPNRYPTASPYLCFRDTIHVDGKPTLRCSYFESQDFNRGNTYTEHGQTVDNLIQRVADSMTIGELGDTVWYGYYEAHLTNLNPSEALYITVTAFDNGDPTIGLQPLESLPGHCYEFAFPVYTSDIVEDSVLKVSVYPNPYKSRFEGPDGRLTSYYEQRHEAPEKSGVRGGLLDDERRIWFINLPREATIRIYTLDGDLVRELHHPDPFLTAYPSILGWDLVTRNAQPVVSGIYIYRVDSNLGTQMGKIVIIK
ncbi:MAG: hypothetical protein Kow0074_13300 [Candidatus Zixiibacteriota bacterium]